MPRPLSIIENLAWRERSGTSHRSWRACGKTDVGIALPTRQLPAKWNAGTECDGDDGEVDAGGDEDDDENENHSKANEINQLTSQFC